MKQYSRFIDFTPASIEQQMVSATIVNAYKAIMNSIDTRKEHIAPTPYDVVLYVGKDLFSKYRDIISAIEEIERMTGDREIVHVNREDISNWSMTCRLIVYFHELDTDLIWPPIGVSPKIYKAFSPRIKKVIFNPPATIVYWDDGSKTVSKVQDGDTWDSEKGLAMAIIKKTMGLKEFNKHFDEHAVNANFWHYATPEVLAKKSVKELGFKPHMDAIVSRYGTDMVKGYLKSVEVNGMEEKKVCQE